MDKELKNKIASLMQKYGIDSKEKVVLEHPYITVESYKIKLNNGETIYRDKIVKNGGTGSACIIIPITSDKKIVTVIQPRVFSKSGVLIDFPAGYIDDGESILDAAKRELEEETGYVSDNYETLVTYYQDEGSSDAKVSIVLARDVVKQKELHLDQDEYLEPVLLTYEDYEDYLKEEGVVSGGSQLAYLNLKIMKNEGKL